MKQKNICIIPARGGSKRIPKKNIKIFFGKPIIQYSIEAAIKSGCFDEVMVSTDDIKIAKMAKKFGASVPFLRSKKTSKDSATVGQATLEVLEQYQKMGQKFDNFCCLFAAAPFITTDDLKNAMAILSKTDDIFSVFPVVKYEYPIRRAFKIDKGWLKMQWRQYLHRQSQQMEPMYHDAGQFYCLKTKRFQKERHFFSINSKPIILPASRVQDVDTIDDWHIAEIKYKMLTDNKKGSDETAHQKDINRTRTILGRWIRRQLRGPKPR